MLYHDTTLRYFTDFPFYGFTASSSSRSSTLIHCAFTHLPFYGFTVFSCSRCPRKSINLPLYGFTLVSFASTPPLRFYALKAARSDRKFTNLSFYGAFLGNNGIYHFTALPFYGAPWQKTCLRPAPYTETPQKVAASALTRECFSPGQVGCL